MGLLDIFDYVFPVNAGKYGGNRRLWIPKVHHLTNTNFTFEAVKNNETRILFNYDVK